MPEFTFRQNARNPGIDTKRPTTEVAWSLGNNIRFQPGYVYKDTGRTLLATAPMPIRSMYSFRGDDNTINTITAGDNLIYRYRNNFTTSQNITPSPAPTSNYTDAWRFALNGGLPIISNGKDRIWKWSNFSSVLSVLSNSPTYAKALTVFGGRLIVGDYQEDGYAWNANIGWTERYKPENWTRGVKVNEMSRRKPFVPENSGNVAHDFVKDFGVAGGRLVIFATENVYQGNPVADDSDFHFSALVPGMSVVGKRLSVSASGVSYFIGNGELGSHGGMDVYRLSSDGLSAIGYDIRNLLFLDINWDAINTGFAYRNPSLREIHFCVPTGTSTVPDKDYIYQEETKTWGIGDCDYTSYSRTIDAVGGTYDGLSSYGTYEGITDERYDLLGQSGVDLPYDVVSNSNGEVLRLGSGFNNNGNPIDAYIDTGDFTFGLPNERKIAIAIMPFFKRQNTKSLVNFQVSYRNELHHPIEWSEKFDFVIGVDEKLYLRRANDQGKYIRLRISSDQLDTPWLLEGYTLFYEFGGNR